ncbi:hypothetical protein KDA_11360 [Dictyobacter alpinus]|uniref:non-specific serine/threonine protein kinase n=1 Tax=Dictyobacter alpinus TaxID=2014873 RepID=A0A402B2S5_9CHLR|nr:inactive serine/threonine-protein kinase VRK3 [Dictyobacter alpinus]GCE25652.1 hypothetical protein KDA_11360 [Dictyobacter alpinus]
MSLTHTSLDQTQPEIVRCTRCNTELPPSATFCGQCGERVEKHSGDKSSPKNVDISDRYRITSLLRRQPPTQVLLALDTQQQRPVVIHDIDITTLDEENRAQAIAAVQAEYDLLRRQRIPGIMPLVDLRYYNGHLYVIAGWPFALAKEEHSGRPNHHISTLQDILQSGLGLPEEQVAINWIYRLSRALEQIHHLEILLGQIDPATILLSQHNYSGEPLLIVSWLPDLLRELVPQPLNHANASPFSAPEVLRGDIEPRSDVYSLGAILYLLLVGVTPDDANKRLQQPLPSLRDRNPHIDSTLDMVVMQALSLQRELRYQSASEFSEALQQFLPQTHDGYRTAPIETSAIKDKNAIPGSSNLVDKNNNRDNEDDEATDSEDMTISIVPLQARMARRYLSRIKTSKLGLPAQLSGEAIVEKGSAYQKQNDAEMVEKQVQEDLSNPYPHSNQDRALTQTPIETDTVSQSNTEAPELAHSEKPTPLAAPMEKQPEQANVAPQQDIAQLATVLIKSDSFEAALAARAAQSETSLAGPPVTEAEKNSAIHDKPETPSGSRDLSLDHLKNVISGSLPGLAKLRHPKDTTAGLNGAGKDNSLLQRMQRFILGEPQHNTSAAALIETPMRIQPNQSYSIRVNIMGRTKTNINPETGGLSALGEEETVHIEVRSALYQNYAYIVQQADVNIPAAGYVAEITMPMQPLSSGPSGRRERLHIFFMDSNRNPLYEKPFVIELFISHLVQSGREGHNVLSIPL